MEKVNNLRGERKVREDEEKEREKIQCPGISL